MNGSSAHSPSHASWVGGFMCMYYTWATSLAIAKAQHKNNLNTAGERGSTPEPLEPKRAQIARVDRQLYVPRSCRGSCSFRRGPRYPGALVRDAAAAEAARAVPGHNLRPRLEGRGLRV